MSSLSIIIPTYRREQVLLDTLNYLFDLVQPGDEVLVIDQTPDHEPQTAEGLRAMAASGQIRWYRKAHPNQAEAMNVGALLAKRPVLLFLDDDIIPSRSLLEGHRRVLSAPDAPPATCGQVLQPWDSAPIHQVVDFDYRFNTAYNQPCDMVSLIGANFAMRRQTYFKVGGMDENYRGSNYRNDAELAYRIFFRTQRKVRFIPEASLRHLHAGGGNRAFGAKDTWGHIGGSIGDYYFAMRCLPCLAAIGYSLRRLVRAPLNRNTIRRPWLVLSLVLREVVAWFIAARRLFVSPHNYIKDLPIYAIEEQVAETAVPRAGEKSLPTGTRS